MGNCLAHGNIKLTDSTKTLQELQIQPNDNIRFVAHVDRTRHSRARQYR
jgi:hypothetical protein